MINIQLLSRVFNNKQFKPIQRVLKNTSIGLLTTFSVQLLTPFLLIYAARTLTKEEFGQFTFALDYAFITLGILSFGSAYGFNALVLRLGSCNPQLVLQRFPNILFVLSLVHFGGSILSLIGLQIFPTIIDDIMLATLLLLFTVFIRLSGPVDSIFR